MCPSGEPFDNLDPDPGNIFICLQFVGKLGPEFVELLHWQDDCALCISGYWLGLLLRALVAATPSRAGLLRYSAAPRTPLETKGWR